MLEVLIALTTVAIVATYTGQFGPRSLFIMTKPVVVGGLSVLTYLYWPQDELLFPIVVAMTTSCLGDTFLLNEKFFLFGLVSFLSAHIALCYSFVQLGAELAWTNQTILLFITFIFFNFVLKPKGVVLRVGVVVYYFCLGSNLLATVIHLMVAYALDLAVRFPRWTLLAPASLLFLVSDATLAVNKFTRPLPLANIAVLSTYYAAQILFVYVYTNTLEPPF